MVATMTRKKHAHLIMGKTKIRAQHIEQLCGFFFGGFQTEFTRPRFSVKLLTFTHWTSFRGNAFPNKAALAARPLIMNFVTRSGNVVGVYVKDQISAKPPLPIHLRLWAFVISARVINIRRNSLAEKQFQSVDVCKSLVPQHDSLFKEKKS